MYVATVIPILLRRKRKGRKAVVGVSFVWLLIDSGSNELLVTRQHIVLGR